MEVEEISFYALFLLISLSTLVKKEKRKSSSAYVAWSLPLITLYAPSMSCINHFVFDLSM